MKIETVDNSAPGSDVLEVSLFGPGYGECVVCHLGDNEWLVVDSCVNQRRRHHPALEYLEGIGVSPLTDVKLVVATHWHDDHVRGLSEVLLQCPSAKFSCSLALRDSEFLNVVGRLNRAEAQAASGLREMRRTFDILEGRAGYRPVRWAISDRPLFTRTTAPRAVVTALSPSDAEYRNALQRFGLLEGEVDQGGRVSARGPNHTAVVLLVEVGNHSALLGADLEETSERETGWTAILASSNRPQVKSRTFKVPHHGSENAHQPRVWEEMLDDPIAMLTPFRRGRVRLPTRAGLREIAARASAVFVSSDPERDLKARMPRAVEAAARLTASRLNELHGEPGQIQARVDHSGITVRLRPPARAL